MIFLKPQNVFQFFFQFFINLIFRLRTSIKKKFNTYPQNDFFLTGDFFRSLASLRNDSVIVFKTLNDFPKKKNYNKFKKKIWIFHNSDEKFDLKDKKKLDFFKPKKCYSQNLVINKKKYNFLPIGLENGTYHNHGETKDFIYLRKRKLIKIPRILFGFNITNRKRVEIKRNLQKFEICDETMGWNSYFYRRILVKYMFVVCPEGNGVDTHRLWEALYLRSIPIIQKNQISNFLIKANLPIMILNNWTDLSKFKEIDLFRIYRSKKNLFSNKYLFQNYWKKKIKKI
jgi:hypothetical protein